MELEDGSDLEFWYLDSSKYENDSRNGLSMPHLVGKMILHGILWPFSLKLLFQYGRRRSSWILMVGLVKRQKRCQKGILHAKISRKSGITQLSIPICFQVTFPIWPPAAILDFGFSQTPPPFSQESWGLIFFRYFKELKSSVKPYYALSGHGTPRLHPTNMPMSSVLYFLGIISYRTVEHATGRLGKLWAPLPTRKIMLTFLQIYLLFVILFQPAHPIYSVLGEPVDILLYFTWRIVIFGPKYKKNNWLFRPITNDI